MGVENKDGQLERIDQKLAASGVAKLKAGQKPNREELGAVRRLERRREEAQRWRYYATIPSKHWKEMSGRRWQQIREQAEMYGLPFGGAIVDLPAVVRALHEFLAKNAVALSRARSADGGDPMLDGPVSPGLEEYRREKAKITKIQREMLEGKTVSVDDMTATWTLLGTILRDAAETIGRQFGEDARMVMEEALNDFDGRVAEMRRNGETPKRLDAETEAPQRAQRTERTGK